MKEPIKSLHQKYHDTEYGFPLQNENELFGRLILEINQAGLSWTTILKKSDAFRIAYKNFSIDAVAQFTEQEVETLLGNPEIIRNKLKIVAAIYNAKEIQRLQKEFGSFYQWLVMHHPLSKADWVNLFKRHFKFTGGEIVGEFLTSIGILPGAHQEDCPIFKEINQQGPLWQMPSNNTR